MNIQEKVIHLYSMWPMLLQINRLFELSKGKPNDYNKYKHGFLTSSTIWTTGVSNLDIWYVSVTFQIPLCLTSVAVLIIFSHSQWVQFWTAFFALQQLISPILLFLFGSYFHTPNDYSSAQLSPIPENFFLIPTSQIMATFVMLNHHEDTQYHHSPFPPVHACAYTLSKFNRRAITDIWPSSPWVKDRQEEMAWQHSLSLSNSTVWTTTWITATPKRRASTSPWSMTCAYAHISENVNERVRAERHPLILLPPLQLW